MARENSRHFATPQLVSTQNVVWETSAEIPYWWRVTTQSWVLSASDWLKRHDQSITQICVVTRHQYGISALVSQTSFRGKPVVASQNVGCFLMLTFNPRFLFVLQRVDQMWSMFNQYVKTRTQDNFKFWIVSLCCSSSNFQPSSCFCLFVCFFSLPDARLCW